MKMETAKKMMVLMRLLSSKALVRMRLRDTNNPAAPAKKTWSIRAGRLKAKDDKSGRVEIRAWPVKGKLIAGHGQYERHDGEASPFRMGWV